MKYLISLISVVFLLVLFFSCSKDEITNPSEQIKEQTLASERSNLPSALDIFNLLTDPVNGYISITSYATYATQDVRGVEIIPQGILKDQSGVAKDFGALNVGSINIPFTTNSFGEAKYGGNGGYLGATNLYGNTLTIDVAGKTVNGITYPELETTFYSPAMIELTNPVYKNNDTLTVSDFVINWIPDPLNSNGVGIYIHYSANDPDNVGISNSSSDAFAVHTEDDGSYTLSAQDLAFIPDNGRANLYIARANYVKSDMKDPSYSVGIYSYSVISYKFTFSR